MEEIERIKTWYERAPKHIKDRFNLDFVESVEDFYNEYGYVTTIQQMSLENIIEKWRIPHTTKRIRI